MPRITAVIFVCNRHFYFRSSLASALSQTAPGVKVLVSDCSDDAAARAIVCEAYEAVRGEYPRAETRLLLHPARLRQYEHIETVLAGVDTEFVALLDDDDRWLPDHLSLAVDWLQEDPRRGLHVADAIIEDNGVMSAERVHSMTLALPGPTAVPRAWAAHLLRRALSSTSGLVFRTAALRELRLPDLPLVDVHLAWHVAMRGYFIKADRTQTFVYTVAGTSFHEKGEYNFYERHLWRVWLVRSSPLLISRRVPIFPLLVTKSLLYLLRRKLRRTVASVGTRFVEAASRSRKG